MNKNQRNTNLEILRIVAMFFIILHHWSAHGFEDVAMITSNFNNILIFSSTIFGEIGVDIFILISSYFMINSNFTFKKLLTLSGEIWFYSLIILLLFLTILQPTDTIDFNMIIQSLFPITQSQYWFITDYILLMLFSPFLNIFIKNLSKINHFKLIILMTIIWCIFPMVTGFKITYTPIILFFLLYLIGSFIRLHLNINNLNLKKLILFFIISVVISGLSYCGGSLIYLITNIKFIETLSSYFWQANCIL